MAPVPSPSDVTTVFCRVSPYAVQSCYHWMIVVLRAHTVVHELSLYRRRFQEDKVRRINALPSFIFSHSGVRQCEPLGIPRQRSHKRCGCSYNSRFMQRQGWTSRRMNEQWCWDTVIWVRGVRDARNEMEN